MTSSIPVLLVPVDFQKTSRKGLSVALDLAPSLKAEVVLLHVCEVPIYPYPGLDPVFQPGLNHEVTDAAKAELERLAKECGASRTIFRKGDPAIEILAAIEEEQPRFVVMGTHGRGLFGRIMMGSVALKILRASAAPVISVRMTDEEEAKASK